MPRRPSPASALCASLCLAFALVAPAAAQTPSGVLRGRVTDATGAVIPQARIQIQPRTGTAGLRQAVTSAIGEFRADRLPAGRYQVQVMAESFRTRVLDVDVLAGEESVLEVTLQPGVNAEEITVNDTHLLGVEGTAESIPGSVDVITESELASARVFQFGEALRKVAGLTVREEEGLGLRPNIGLRGLNPTRSSKLLLLEDGVPLSYAPYGDNASYYHPPIERFSSIEVLKGSGQILYGPVTVGGVINYITPEPTSDFRGSLTLTGGNRGYFNGVLGLSGTYKGTGVLLDVMRKQSDGARENLHSALHDYTVKLTRNFLSRHHISVKGNFYQEDSNVTYSGLRLDEYQADPRQNPFPNDFFNGRRHGVTVNHSVALTSRLLLSTNIYGSVFTRDWWRQSSNSGQRPNDAADPICGGMQNLNTTCGNEGRQRQYHTAGIEPHLRWQHRLFGVKSETDIGFRAHFEKQYRIQRNGNTPTARSGPAVENNIRRNQAYAWFVQNRFQFGSFTLTPGVRIEHVDYQRTNQLANGGAGLKGATSLTQAVPGVGVSWSTGERLTLFAGVHRGFAPPRTEDIVSNAGGAIDLLPELSWNFEAGLRSKPWNGVRLDATWFRMDYENQIVPASLAGGVGAALTNGGQTLHQGFEFTSRLDTGVLRGSRHNLYFLAAVTWLPTARFEGVRFSNVPGFSTVSVSGNRLPYAAMVNVTGAMGYSHPRGIELQLEAVYLGSQFADDLNTVASTTDGQRGLLPSNTTWNATLNYHFERQHTTFFLAAKNLADSTFIVDRSRGILPSAPRLIQTGLKFSW